MDTTYTTYWLGTYADGSVHGTAQTNDDEDKGYPTKFSEWSCRYRSRVEALAHTGGTHRGWLGSYVNVYLDGVLVDVHGNPVAEEDESHGGELALDQDEAEDVYAPWPDDRNDYDDSDGRDWEQEEAESREWWSDRNTWSD